MRKIKHYRVDVTDKQRAGIIGPEQKFEVKEFNVIGENDQNLVIDDLHFTTLSQKKRSYSTNLDDPSIHLYANDTVWGNRITYSLYTEKNKHASTIKKEIEAEVAKKYGFFSRGIDLSFITDKEVA